jgi:uncharacterized membrane protein
MIQKYKKLILSQICGLLAVVSLYLAYTRYTQTQNWGEQVTVSFLFFAAVLFVAEIKLVMDWLKTRSL